MSHNKTFKKSKRMHYCMVCGYEAITDNELYEHFRMRTSDQHHNGFDAFYKETFVLSNMSASS